MSPPSPFGKHVAYTVVIDGASGVDEAIHVRQQRCHSKSTLVWFKQKCCYAIPAPPPPHSQTFGKVPALPMSGGDTDLQAQHE